MRFSAKEKKLIQLIKEGKASPSHDFDHLKRVAAYAEKLAEIHKGKRDIVVGASLLHDLGRSVKKHRGKDSALEGARLARPLLTKAGYSDKDSKLIVKAIMEHDQPEFHSKDLESRALKDADFLDGFGARGILRSVMYAGETGGGVKEATTRLRDTGKKRLDGLEFVETRRLAWRQYRMTEVFLDELEKIADIGGEDYKGKLIVVEGISGSGKDTQLEMMSKYLSKKGLDVVTINHPTDFLKSLWRKWREKVDDRASEAFLMLADRVRMVREEIRPALRDGKVVVSSRSSISAQVYQADDDFQSSFYRLMFSFEPVPDLVVYLKISPEEAIKRADKRVKQGGEKDRGFFGKKQKQQLERYKAVLRNYPKVEVVDAARSKEAVHAKVVACVDKVISIR